MNEACSHGAIFCECKCDKISCVDVNETVRMVRLLCICMCDVEYEWVPYQFRAIVMWNSNTYLYSCTV